MVERAKRIALIIVGIISLVLEAPAHSLVIQALVLSAAAVFVLSRPAPPSQ